MADGAHAVSCWVPLRAGDLIAIQGLCTEGTVMSKERGLWAWTSGDGLEQE